MIAVVALAGGAAVAADRQPAQRGAAAGWKFTCGYAAFHLDVFDATADAEMGPGPPAEALRRALADDRYEYPDHGWRVLAESAEAVEYGYGVPPDVSFLRVEPRNEDGSRWEWASSGECGLSLYAKSLNVGTWKPRGEAPGPDDAKIKALVTEQACAGGRSPDGRIRQPRISYGLKRIVIAPLIEPPPGRLQTCQGNPPGKYTFRLSEPIGDRVVADGSNYPFKPRIGGER